MSHEYSENILIQKNSGKVLSDKLGWEVVFAYDTEILGESGTFGRKLVVFWHTQGSGKSYSMVFLAQKIRRKFEGSPTFVILTDRDELNKQISDTCP